MQITSSPGSMSRLWASSSPPGWETPECRRHGGSCQSCGSAGNIPASGPDGCAGQHRTVHHRADAAHPLYIACTLHFAQSVPNHGAAYTQFGGKIHLRRQAVRMGIAPGAQFVSRLATTRSLITAPPSRLEAARVDSFISVPPFTGGQAAGTSKDPAGRMMHCPKALCFYYNIN